MNFGWNKHKHGPLVAKAKMTFIDRDGSLIIPKQYIYTEGVLVNVESPLVIETLTRLCRTTSQPDSPESIWSMMFDTKPPKISAVPQCNALWLKNVSMGIDSTMIEVFVGCLLYNETIKPVLPYVFLVDDWPAIKRVWKLKQSVMRTKNQ
jgi:hypothetical protein